MREAIAYEFDDFRLDVKRQELQKNGQPVPLTHKAYQVLLILVQNSEQTVEKEYIYEQLWGESFVEDANLTQHIYVVRKALGNTESGESYIETVSRTGYRFTAKVMPVLPVNIIEPNFRPRNGAEPALKRDPIQFNAPQLRLADAPPPDQANDIPENNSEVPENSAAHISVSGLRNRLIIVGASLALIAIVFGLIYYFRTKPPVAGTVRSIAILPFNPIGAETANDKLGLGMADSIITRLSKLQQIPVRPTSSVMHYIDAPPSNSVVAGKEMGVDTVLEGTVQHEGDRIRVSVKLIDVANGQSLWAENFDENYTSIFSVQDSISQKVVSALAINLTKQQEELIAQDSTTSVDALRAFQMGVYLFSTRSKENMLKAVEYFEQATRFDPNYAKAYAIEADTYNMLRYYQFADPKETREKASVLVDKALAINPNLPEAYIALGNLQLGEKDGAIKAKASLQRAIELSPFNSTAHLRYAWLLVSSDIDAASEHMRLAQEYDPLSAIANGAYCNMLTFQRRYDEAIKFGERAAELGHESPSNRILLADAYSLAGRHSDAIAQIQKRIEETTGAEKLTATGSLGFYLIRAGRIKEAEEIYARLKAAKPSYIEAINDLTLLAYSLGRKDEGFAYFQEAYIERRLPLLMFHFNPIWDNVRADSRTSEFLERSIQNAAR
ncbi:MAG: winged helix-turn-helix domain-containing protein [Pyrinomonadaceae bacterium]